MVAGLQEGLWERQVQERRSFAEQQEQEMAVRREEIRQENLLARELAGWHLDKGVQQGVGLVVSPDGFMILSSFRISEGRKCAGIIRENGM